MRTLGLAVLAVLFFSALLFRCHLSDIKQVQKDFQAYQSVDMLEELK